MCHVHCWACGQGYIIKAGCLCKQRWPGVCLHQLHFAEPGWSCRACHRPPTERLFCVALRCFFKPLLVCKSKLFQPAEGRLDPASIDPCPLNTLHALWHAFTFSFKYDKSMRRNTQDAVQKTRRAKQAAADRKTESSSISFICTAHKIPTATMHPSGLKVMYNTQRPRCGYRTGPGRQSKERRKRRERKKNLELKWKEKMQQDMEVESHKRKCCCSDQQGVGHSDQHQQPGHQVQNHFNPLPSPLWCSLWTPPRGYQHG